jgi:hypothetical protein
MNSTGPLPQEGFDGLTTMNRGAIPNDEQIPLAVTPTEFTQKPDDIFASKRPILASDIKPTGGRNSGNQA